MLKRCAVICLLFLVSCGDGRTITLRVGELETKYNGKNMEVWGCVVVLDVTRPPALMDNCTVGWFGTGESGVLLQFMEAREERNLEVARGIQIEGEWCGYGGRLFKMDVGDNVYVLTGAYFVDCTDAPTEAE